MKLMKKIVIALFAVFVTANFASAQVPKFAHINSTKILDSIPTMLEANKTINDFVTQGEKVITDMERSLEESYSQYLIDKPNLSSVMQEIREKQLMEQQQLIEYKKGSLEQDLQVLQVRLIQPIYDNFKKAVKIVAERHKVTYVLEEEAMYYVDPASEMDLTAEVKAELIKLEAVRTAPKPTGTGG